MKNGKLRIVLISPKGPLYRHRGGIFRQTLRYMPLTLPTLAALVPPELNAEVVCLDEGIRDVIEVSADPIIASHSNARALCAHPRNLTDDLARALAERGGVIGLHMLNQFVSGSTRATLDQFLDHVDHFVRLVGPDHVGLGPDCMEQWPADVYRTLWAGTEMAALEFHYPPEFDSLAKCLNVTRGLVARGHDDTSIRGILGDNVLRVFERVLGRRS